MSLSATTTWPNAAPDKVGPHVLKELILLHGGFTLCGKTGDPVATGMAVATRSSMSLEFHSDVWSDRTVSEWLARVGTRRWSLFCDLGGWLDEGGVVHLDVVLVVPRALSYCARLIGRFSRQHSMYDLDRLQTVVLR
jgi:hypothetical protein